MEAPKYKLVRKRDGLVKIGPQVKWIEYDENNRYKNDHFNVGVGRSLIIGPFDGHLVWQTTSVKSFKILKDGTIKFKTLNSDYTLTKS